MKAQPKGIRGKILEVDLSTGCCESKEYPEEFFRKYLGGAALGTYFLLNRTSGKTCALDPENLVTIAPGPATGAAVSGVSRCSVTAISPETGAVGDSQAGGNFGPYLKRAGFDAVVLTGKAEKLGFLHIQNGRAEFIPYPELTGRGILEVHDLLKAAGQRKVSILQCGPAGENLVRFASLASDLNNVYGRTGMGAVFGSKNLRAIVVEPEEQIDFADPQKLKSLAQKAVRRVNEEGAGETLKKYGTPGIVGGNALSGNLACHNYSSGWHPEYERLDGSNFHDAIASKGTTCFGCAVACRKTVKTESPYRVSDRLGGPEFETLGLLGSNLDIFDPVAVAKANELCNDLGIDTISMGGLASYLCESVEKKAITAEALGIDGFGFGVPEGIFRLIELTGRREGIGEVIADGFLRAVEHFGSETAAYAVHSKNHGFAVHMPQVKASMALLYAVSPIGADHMSSEHDWIASDTGEPGRGLGLLNSKEPEFYGTEKVRAIMYSQYYYGLLDSLGLCMFVWGPGSLFSYPDLEELIRGATGWEVTFWELMKAGERRINMMRLYNLQRGFGESDDCLPERMFAPLKGGPSEGKAVDRDGFSRMKESYYALMGWDEAGRPRSGKLQELGLQEFLPNSVKAQE